MTGVIDVMNAQVTIRGMAWLMCCVGVVCAVPACHLTRIRREAGAASAIQAAINADHYTAGRHSGEGGSADIIGPSLYSDFWYDLAGSNGQVKSIAINGERSAQAFSEYAECLPYVEAFRIDVRPGTEGPQFISQRQVDAASRCYRLHTLEINGDFSPGVRLIPFKDREPIHWVKIETHHMSSQMIEDLGQLRIENLTLFDHALADNDGSYGRWIPSAALASFKNSPIRTLTIRGLVDDEALELIAKAPRLEQLDILSGFYDATESPKITNGGLVRACQDLHVWWLKIDDYQAVFDDCANALAGIQELRRLELSGLTPECRDELKRLRPDIDID